MRVDEGSDHCQRQASHLAELSGANATQIYFLMAFFATGLHFLLDVLIS